MSQYFYELSECFIGSAKVELNLSNYVKKANLKGATGIDTSMLASKTTLASLNVDKLKTVAVDSSNLSNLVIIMLSKRLCAINSLSKAMLLILL